jgi:cytoskeletal protein RodZ
MKRRILLAVVTGCAVLLLFLAASIWIAGSDTPPNRPMTEDVSVHDVPSAASRPTAVAPTPASAGRSEAAAPEPATDVETAGISQVDKNARDWVHRIVQDRAGSPVANADHRLVGRRTKQARGAH